MNIEIEVRTLPTTQQPLGTLLTTIDMPDLVEESFRMHISLCDDEYFHFGGCVAAWIKFTTTKLTYGNNTPIRWDRVGMFVRTYTVDENDNRTYTLLGTFYGKEYTETVNHTRVDVTAYDPMYLIATCDLTKWYNEFVPYAQENFILQFMTRAYDEVLSKTPVYAETVGGIDVDESEAFTEAFGNIQWKRTVVIDGREEPLMSGTITYGKLLKDFCIACGYNATLDVKPTGYASLHYRNVTAAKTPIAISPTEYRDLEYSSFDTDTFTNVRIKAYNSMFDATDTETMTYGILNNWITNVGTQYSGADQTQAETLLTMLQRMIYRPCSFTTFERKCNIGDYVDITDTNGNVYHAIVMQEDIGGIVGASFTYTCLATGDYYKETGTVDYYDDNLFSIDDTYPTVTEAATRTNLSIGDTMKTIIGKIKKFFADLKTVAFTGSYDDLSNKPSILAPEDAWRVKGGTALTASSESPFDLNTLVTAGTYYMNNDGQVEYVLNKPALYTANKRFTIIVQRVGDLRTVIRQIFISGYDNKVFWRYTTNTGSSWLAWEEMAYADKMWRLASGTKLNPTSETHVDLDTIISAGTYFITSDTANYVDNKPTTSSNRFTLIVQAIGDADENRIKQIYMPRGTQSNYIRYKDGSTATWSTWKETAFTEQIPTDYIKTSNATSQTIAATSVNNPLGVKTGSGGTRAYISYLANNGTEWGRIGVNNNGVPIFSADGTTDSRIFANADGYTWQLAAGIPITATAEAHADLNTFTTFGTYYMSSNSANLVDNRPVTNNNRFTLIVMRIGNNANCIRQIYMPYGNNVFYVRRTADGGSTWDSAWTYLALGTHLDSYVKLSGSTAQIITTSAADYSYPLEIKPTHNTLSLIRYDDKNGTELGRIGVNSSNKPVFFYNGTAKELLTNGSFLPTTGGQMTGAITFAQGSIVQQTANTMPFFLGIDAFASGGAMKWQTTAGVVNALNSGASGLVKKTTNIQSGTVTISAVGTATTLTFGTAFGGVPKLSLTPVGSSLASVCAYASSVTASGATVFCNKACTLHWIAYY